MDSRGITAIIVSVVALIACAHSYASTIKYHENPALAHKLVKKFVISEADCRTVDVSKAQMTLLESDSECLVIVPHAQTLFCGILSVDAKSVQVINSQTADCVDVQRFLNKLPRHDIAIGRKA